MVEFDHGLALWRRILGSLGLGGPLDIEALHQRVRELEGKGTFCVQLAERAEEPEAVRAANRSLMARLVSGGYTVG